MILIRADANEKIGSGHIMRCLSIAKAFAHRGFESLFITADNGSKSLIEQNGFKTFCLESEWTDMESEIPRIKKIINEINPEILIIDSYYATGHYLKMLSEECKVAFIDDMNLECYDVDVIINYNIYAKVFDYSWYDGARTKLLLHPQYAPLRDEFKNCTKHKIKNVTDVLISAGGADPEHVTERIISGLCNEMTDFRFHFVVGALNPRLEAIKMKSREAENVVLHINEKQMSELMKKCDIAISAAGTTLYELCATGIPTITYTLADNQLLAAEQFNAQGIMINAGDCRNDNEFENRLMALLKKMINDENLRSELSENMQTLVDGNGANRIVEKLAEEINIT